MIVRAVGRPAAEIRREAARAAQAKESEYAERIKKVDELLPILVQRAADKYAGIDWPKLAREEPEQYIALKAEFDADKEVYEKARSQRAKAQEEEARKAEDADKQERAADLTAMVERNPQYKGKDGAARLREEAVRIQDFAKALGFTDEALSKVTGVEFELLRDAMNYRTVKKAAASPASKKPAPAPKTTKPAARKPAGDVVKKRLNEAQGKLNQSVKTGRDLSRSMAAMMAAQRSN
jgi:hypothetical protein